MKKRLMLCIGLCIMSLLGYSQTTFTADGLNYEVTSITPPEVTLTGSTNAITSLDIPETVSDGVESFTVVAIGTNAFVNKSLTSVMLPSTLRTIGNLAFENNLLTSISIPESVETIGQRAFRVNDLEAIVIPNSVTSLGNQAFQGNEIATATLSENITSIGDGTFDVNNLTSIVIPNGITNIGSRAFRDNQLTDLTIPSSVTNITNEAFVDNPLETITAEGVTPAIIGVNSFGSRSEIDLTIPNGTETDYATAAWTGFATINGLISLEVGITFEANGLSYIITALAPNEVNATGGTTIPTDLVIPENVTIQDVEFTVVGIGNDAFSDKGITSLTLPNSVISIGNDAFLLNQLTSITLPESVTSIGQNSFGNNPLAAIEALGTVPATIFSDSFSTRSIIDLTVPDGTEAAYETAGWTGFKSVNGIVDFVVGDTFTENTFDYEIISLMPNEVAITGGTAVPLELVIDGSVISGGLNFSVVAVGGGAFDSLGLTDVTFPNTIRTIGGGAFNNNALEIVVIPEGVTDVPGGCFRNNNITSVSLPQSLLTLGSRSFENNQLAVLTLPINVSAIAQNAFKNNPITTIASLNPNAPSVVLGTIDDSFNNEGNIDLTVPTGTEIEYVTAGWIGFRSLNGVVIGDTFTVNNFNYTILSFFPSTVEITGGISIPQDLVIAGNVSNEGVDFTVTRVGDAAFDNEGLTSLSLPNSLITIGNQAFRINSIGGELVIPNSVTNIGNQVFEVNQIESLVISENINNLGNNTFRDNLLTSITIPAGVTTMGNVTFRNNPLTAVISLGSAPPSIVTGSNDDPFFQLRDAIDLTVPVGATLDYTDAGWTDFKSITETSFDIVIAPKVFLQGASLNPNTGEENLMRDDLREADLLPITSPYGDGATVNPTLFDNFCPDGAIVDWVLIELREGADNENTTVVASTSALLQRDGDIVGVDGISPITFTADEGDYFIAIKHRNHIGVMTAVPTALSSISSTIDFTQDIASAKGENLALTALVNGNFAMIAGDADGSSNILNTDITEALSLSGGGEGYSTADADMNGFVLNSDIQLLVLANSGTVQQFD